MLEETLAEADSGRRVAEETQFCPECGGRMLTSETSEISCRECGLVDESGMIDFGPDWRAFSIEEADEKSHHGPPGDSPLTNELMTFFPDGKDAYGRPLSPKAKSTFHRLARYQNIVSGNIRRNFRKVTSNIGKLRSALKLSSIIEKEAVGYYRQAFDKGLIRGRTIEDVSAAAIYLACRQNNIPITLDELADVVDRPVKKIGRSYRHIARELNKSTLPPDPRIYLPRLISELNLAEKTHNLAVELIEQFGRDRRAPLSVASAAIYIAANTAGERVTQRKIAIAAGITGVTVRNTYREMNKILNLGFVPPETQRNKKIKLGKS